MEILRVKSPRFLIVRLSALGDVIQGLPMACALRERFPDAFVAWAVQRPADQLLEGHEAIDRVISLPRGWLKSPAGVWRLRRMLRELRFDVALDGQGLSKSAVLARLSGAPRRIGFGPPWGRELSRWLNTECVDTRDMHIIERNLRLLRPLGIEAPAIRFLVPEHASDRQAAQQMLVRAVGALPFAMISPGAGWASKLWPTARYAAVASHLGTAHGLATLVTAGTEQERELARRVVADAPGHARLAPPTTLAELAAVARRARIFIGSDTGPLHLAAAVGTPCVGLYGPWPGHRHGPIGPPHILVQKAQFSGTTRQRRAAPKELMEAIAVADVCEACDRILTAPAQLHAV